MPEFCNMHKERGVRRVCLNCRSFQKNSGVVLSVPVCYNITKAGIIFQILINQAVASKMPVFYLKKFLLLYPIKAGVLLQKISCVKIT